MIADTDLKYLERCITLAAEALAKGHQPFGSILVSESGEVLFEDFNKVGQGDHTQHPEFAIARWAVNNLSEEQRLQSVVYTSGEPCSMCAAAHGWVGLGRIVYASSAHQLSDWLAEIGVPASRVRPLSVSDVITETQVDGPVPEMAERLRRMHVAYYENS